MLKVKKRLYVNHGFKNQITLSNIKAYNVGSSCHHMLTKYSAALVRQVQQGPD